MSFCVMCFLYLILHIIIHPAVVKAPVRMRILSDNMLRHKQAILLIKFFQLVFGKCNI